MKTPVETKKGMAMNYPCSCSPYSRCKDHQIEDLKKDNAALRVVLREVFSMFINLGAIRGTNIVLRFSEDADAETVYDDITEKMIDCLHSKSFAGPQMGSQED